MTDLLTQERTHHETKVPTPSQAADNTLSEDTISQDTISDLLDLLRKVQILEKFC